MQIVKTVLTAYIAVLLVPLAFGGESSGGDSSGGGTAIILPDKTVILADPYLPYEGGRFHCRSGERGKLNPTLVEEIKKAGTLLIRYGASASVPRAAFAFEESHFVQNQVLNTEVEYCFVDELPKVDRSPGVSVPDGAEAHAIAYTEGWVTWIRKDLFRQMSVLEQTKLIVHERLHAVLGNIPHGPIVDITNGLDLVLRLYHLQVQGDRPILSSEQIGLIQKLQQRIYDLQMYRSGMTTEEFTEFLKNFVITPNGGGLIHKKSWISDTAYIGVGSLVPEKGAIHDRAVLINSALCPTFRVPWRSGRSMRITWPDVETYFVDEDALVQDSWIGTCQRTVIIGNGAQLLNSQISLNSTWWGSAGFRMAASSIADGLVLHQAYEVTLYPKSVVKNFTLEMDAGVVGVSSRPSSIIFNPYSEVLNYNPPLKSLPKLIGFSGLFANSRKHDDGRIVFGELTKPAKIDFESQPICKITEILVHDSFLDKSILTKKDFQKLCWK